MSSLVAFFNESTPQLLSPAGRSELPTEGEDEALVFGERALRVLVGGAPMSSSRAEQSEAKRTRGIHII
jgi:hypothetical protein